MFELGRCYFVQSIFTKYRLHNCVGASCMDGHDDEIMTKYFGLERSTLLHEHLDPWIGHVRLDGCIPQEKG